MGKFKKKQVEKLEKKIANARVILEDIEEILEKKLDENTEIFDDKSEAWQESAIGEEYSNYNGEMDDKLSDIRGVIDELIDCSDFSELEG